ncbi:MAG: hypothetical protein JWM80_6404 [Cyanobacteria bacterium RYN_339]|nr:hypothetical protein [Cyanobacteria bacterium RYN_339]
MYDHFEQTMEAPAASPQVIWVAPQEATAKEADPYDVINFLLKKVEDQQARLTEHEGFAELQNQEIDIIKSALEAKSQELEATQADYDVMLQNGLAIEHDLEGARQRAMELEAELEGFKARAGDRPKIQLPFHTEQKLAKLGYGDTEAAV